MKVLFITVSVGAALFYTPVVSACRCVRSTNQSEFTLTSAVFEGEWLKNDDVPRGERAEFQIVRIWKGLEHNPERVELFVPEGLDFCGFPASHLPRTPGAGAPGLCEREERAAVDINVRALHAPGGGGSVLEFG